MSNTIDVSLLPLPDAVEPLSEDVIFTGWKTLLTTRDPAYTGLVESDPAYIQGEAVTCREMLLRQRVNDAVSATFLATARGPDLDIKAADYNVQRQLIDPGDPDAVPPRDPVYESDDQLRQRAWLSQQALSAAGPYGAYQYFALSADVDVLDARAYGPEDHTKPGEVHLYVLSRTGSGAAPQALLDRVFAVANADDVRPLTDYLLVKSATVTPYRIVATLHVKSGPDAQSVIDAADGDAQLYADTTHRIGQIVGRSGIDRALHQAGVEYVTLTEPAADLLPSMGEAFWCSEIVLSVEQEENYRDVPVRFTP